LSDFAGSSPVGGDGACARCERRYLQNLVSSLLVKEKVGEKKVKLTGRKRLGKRRGRGSGIQKKKKEGNNREKHPNKRISKIGGSIKNHCQKGTPA